MQRLTLFPGPLLAMIIRYIVSKLQNGHGMKHCSDIRVDDWTAQFIADNE